MTGTRRRTRIVLSLVVLLAATTTGCGREKEVQLAGSRLLDLEADQVMVGVEHYMTHEGVRRAHLVADTAYFRDEASTVRFRHYDVDFFGPDGSRRSTLTAVEGQYDLRSGDMQAQDSVVVTDPDSERRLYTERLVYDAARNRLESNVDFVMIRGRDTIRGTGFVTDPGLDSLRTTRPGGVFPPAGEEGSAADSPATSPGSGARGGGGAERRSYREGAG